MSTPTETATHTPQAAKYRIWAMHCPFTKAGSPVVGSFGKHILPVVIMHMETWNRLCAAIPELASSQFEVGSYD